MALAIVAVPLAILCGVFAYNFNRRKAGCDEVIDDPPRSDYMTATRRQRDWFDPERLDQVLTPIQVRLCKIMAEGDADLRAAVRADERAQGAYSASNVEYSQVNGVASDGFIDAFAILQGDTAGLVDAMRYELRMDPDWRALSKAGVRRLIEKARRARSGTMSHVLIPVGDDPASFCALLLTWSMRGIATPARHPLRTNVRILP